MNSMIKQWSTNMKYVLLSIAALMTSIAVQAAEPKDTKYGSDLPFLEGVLIEIQSYDPETQTYQVSSPEFTGEGEAYVTPEGLARGVKAINLDLIKRKPTSIVGQQFKTDQKVPTLFDEEREARKIGAPIPVPKKKSK